MSRSSTLWDTNSGSQQSGPCRQGRGRCLGRLYGRRAAAPPAILDRLLHHSTTINIKGESYRLKEKRHAGLLGRAVPAQPEELDAQQQDPGPSPRPQGTS